MSVTKGDSVRRNALYYALWGFGVLSVAFLFRNALLSPLRDRDFVVFWVAGKLAMAGQATDIYHVEALRAAAKQVVGDTVVRLTYPYPPHALFAAAPLSWMPLTVAYWVWQAVSAILFWFAARPYLPSGFPKILVLLTPAAIINVLFGQGGL